MTGENLYEVVSRKFPHVSKVEFLRLLNDALAKFCRETKIYEKTITGDSGGSTDEQNLVTVSGQRMYQLPADVLFVRRVDYDGKKILRANIEKFVEEGDTT